MKRYMPLIFIVAVLVIAFGGGALVKRSFKKAPAARTAPASNTVTAHIRGITSAPVTIEEFGDYQCPPCGALHPEIRKIEAEFGDKVRMIFRQFPLPSLHRHAILAARSAEAAGLQGRFWDMHDRLYTTQNIWSGQQDARQTFTDYARDLGMNVEQFLRDLDGAQTNARVLNDIRWGESIGVDGTPTVFINGRAVTSESVTLEGLRKAVNDALRQKGL